VRLFLFFYIAILLSACGSEINISDAEITNSISHSDDFSTHTKIFFDATKKLVTQGSCSTSEISEVGGWMKSVINHPDKPVYFIYCGGMDRSNRIYLNAETGDLFK